MKNRNIIIALIIVSVVLIYGFWIKAPKSINEPVPITPFNSDFDELRIENEDKLVVPADRLDEVWDYLLNRLVIDKTYIHSLNPAFDSYWYDEVFTDVYFDTPDLIMLNHQSGIRHRNRINLSNPEHEKSGRSLIQIKLNAINDNEQSRGELKFDVDPDLKPDDEDDLHPVLGLLDDSDRSEFKDVMKQLNIDPYQLTKILTLTQHRRSIYITVNGSPFMSIRLDEVKSTMLWVNFTHYEIEPELNEIPYTQAGEEKRAEMEVIKTQIVEDIQQQFPEIQRDLTPKYNKAFFFFEDSIPHLRFLIKNRLYP